MYLGSSYSHHNPFYRNQQKNLVHYLSSVDEYLLGYRKIEQFNLTFKNVWLCLFTQSLIL